MVAPVRFATRPTGALSVRQRLAARGLRAAVYAVLTLVSISTVLPLLWMVVTSLKTQPEFLRNAWGPPLEPTAAAYVELFNRSNFGRYFLNSIVVTTSAVVMVVGVGAMAAFALARYRFRGRSMMVSYFLIGQMIPATVLIVPLYLIVRALQMLNTYQGLVFAYTAGALPLVIFLLRGFFMTIPSEIEDAARIDGASEWQLFARIILPLGAPGLATAAIFEFLFIWNDFVLVLVVMQRNVMRTLTLAVFQAVGEYGTDFPSLFAGLTVSAVPVIVVYLLFTRQFVRGLTAGALKG
jgi:raffinose/stachyose/melibiose transport system permease protein